MSLDLCILASGSAGNCSVVRSPRGVLLIDGGLGPRSIDQRLRAAGCGVRADDVAGVCLTHLDRDHLSQNFVTWVGRRGIPVFCHADKVADLHAMARRQTVTLRNLHPFTDETFEPVDGLKVDPVPLAHDAEGSHGFVLSVRERLPGTAARRIGFATDLGRVPASLVERFCAHGGLDVLAIESNYCPRMQLNSPRPAFLKHRIMGGHGHLSNQQALAAVRQTLDRHQALDLELPANIVLLHRSRECNCPDRVREVFAADRRAASRLVLAEQGEPTGWLRRRAGFTPAKQMTFAWG